MTPRTIVLIRKAMDMIEFDLAQLVFDQVVSHAAKVHVRHLLPFLSLIFQVLAIKNLKVMKIAKRCERVVPEFKFSPK